jgi:hypothetical protein
VATAPEADELAERLKARTAQASSLEAKIIATATQLVSTLQHTAEVFEDAASLAEYDTERRAASGRSDAEEEHQVAARAREAAHRARSYANERRRFVRERAY